jgi:hypothetical protein
VTFSIIDEDYHVLCVMQVRGVLSYESLCNPTCEPQLLRVVASFGLLQSLLQLDPTRQCFIPTKAGCRNVTLAMRLLETIAKVPAAGLVSSTRLLSAIVDQLLDVAVPYRPKLKFSK